MNAIAAHKNELETLLVNLSRDAAISGMDFVALLNGYIARLDTNCLDTSECIDSTTARTIGELAWNLH